MPHIVLWVNLTRVRRTRENRAEMTSHSQSSVIDRKLILGNVTTFARATQFLLDAIMH